jgi:Ser/Thr protein kinase RdoA (MazF antagonist)
MESAYESIARDLLSYLENMFAKELQNLRIHGDCHLGNVLWRDPLPHFVDFDDTLMGPAIQDMGMLFSGAEDEQARQIGTISKAYDEFRPFPHNELRFVEGLRTMRMIHHAAWIARRWHDPAFPQAFPWFDSPKYWSDQVLSLREQLALLAHS